MDFEHVPSYKAQFEFKTKMQNSKRSKITALVPLFKLTDESHKVKMNVEDTLDTYGAVVIVLEHKRAKFQGFDIKTVSPMLRKLQMVSGPKVNVVFDESLQLDDLGLDYTTLEAI